MSKFKVGDKVRIVKMENDIVQQINIGDVGTILKDLGKDYDYALTVQIDRINDYFDFRENELELYKEEIKGDKMEKTFKEVIADIKQGEVWESEYKTIFKNKDMILISDKNGSSLSTFGFCDNKKFKLKRKEYTFEEAFKAYEEGREIEGDFFRYKKRNGEDYYSKTSNKWEFYSNISVDEIRHKWYIN